MLHFRGLRVSESVKSCSLPAQLKLGGFFSLPPMFKCRTSDVFFLCQKRDTCRILTPMEMAANALERSHVFPFLAPSQAGWLQPLQLLAQMAPWHRQGDVQSSPSLFTSGEVGTRIQLHCS